MCIEAEAHKILKDHSIPYYSGVNGISTLMRLSEIDLTRLRHLGFRVSQGIAGQIVVSYKGNRFGLIL